jgi:diacylglycerol kinase family enzyme
MAAPAFHIVFNASAGAVLKTGEEDIRRKIEASGIEALSVNFFEGKDMMAGLTKLKKTGEPILLGGGDGTLMRCAPLFMDTPGQLGIIPMGTMNLLANDLGLPISIDEALKAYAEGAKKIRIDVGSANGVPCLCCAALGVFPEASNFREENRGTNEALLVPQLAMFVFKRIDAKRRFQTKLDGKLRILRTAALIISNNLLKEDNELLDPAFKKDSLQDGKLGVYSLVPQSSWDKLRMLFRLQFGNWKKDSVLSERVAAKVEVKTGRGEEDISLDGETQKMKTPLRFEVLKKALTLLVPKQAAAAAKAA